MFRKAILSDLSNITTLCEKIQIHMNQVNDIKQWDDGYPNKEVFLDDIQKEQLYVLEIDNILVGFIVINDVQYDCYNQVTWRYQEQCRVIHRFGISPDHLQKGYGSQLLKATILEIKNQNYNYIKIDTSSRNQAMNAIIKKFNFQFLGNMHFENNPIAWNCYDLLIDNI